MKYGRETERPADTSHPSREVLYHDKHQEQFFREASGMKQGLQRNDHLFHYIPNEICIVVTVFPIPGVNRPYDQTYERVREWLNGALKTPPPSADGAYQQTEPTALERDLAMPQSFAAAHDGGDLLQPITRAPGFGLQTMIDRWVLLPHGVNQTTAIHFYQVGGASKQPASQARAQEVRGLVNLINRRFRGHVIQNTPSGPVRIKAATPHWLGGAVQGAHISGGPGTAPESPKPPIGDGHIHFSHPGLERVVEAGRAAAAQQDTSQVVVAVLDTCPAPDVVKAASGKNWLLQDVYDHVQIEGPPSLPETYFNHLSDYLPNWQGALNQRGTVPQEHYLMPDHGLFATGIIRSIAPIAEIHLIRVLNDYGVGDLLALTNVLHRLPGVLLSGENSGKRLIVNLSLLADVPPSEELVPFWFPETSKNLQTLLSHWADICDTLNIITSSITEVASWLEEQGVLVVAAAGNDNLTASSRPEPRLPARLDSVLSVAAVDGSQSPSTYSNRGDLPMFSNGVAVFGGNAAKPVPPNEPPQIQEVNGEPDAILGIFSAETLPFGGANKTGWAYWAGTSFATPIVTGIAANVWARLAGSSPATIRTRIQSFANTAENALNCNAIVAKQT